MAEKNLASKAVDIKGKKYVLVADRIIYFNEMFPKGCVITRLVSNTDSEHIIFRAEIYPDGIGDSNRKFVGHAQEVVGEGYINKTSALENAETSAVGRALAMMGIGVIDSVASVDEINKAETSSYKKKYAPKKIPPKPTGKKAEIINLCKEINPLLDDKEVADFIKEETGLDPSAEKNWKSIIDMLQVLKQDNVKQVKKDAQAD